MVSSSHDRTRHDRTRHDLAGGAACPYLGSTDGPELPFDHPSRRNLCGAQTKRVRQGLRWKKVSQVRISRERQAAHCLGTFNECAHFQRRSAAQEAARAREAGAPEERPGAHRPRAGKKRHHRRAQHPPSRLQRLGSRLSSPRWKPLLQAGAAGLTALLLAGLLTVFFAAKPAGWVEFVFNTIVTNDIKAFGLGQRGKVDKHKSAGLVTGGNLRSLKKLSRSQKAKLKKKVKGLTAAQKAMIKRMRGR